MLLSLVTIYTAHCTIHNISFRLPHTNHHHHHITPHPYMPQRQGSRPSLPFVLPLLLNNSPSILYQQPHERERTHILLGCWVGGGWDMERDGSLRVRASFSSAAWLPPSLLLLFIFNFQNIIYYPSSSQCHVWEWDVHTYIQYPPFHQWDHLHMYE